MSWWDFFKIFTIAMAPDPLTAQDQRDFSGAGTPQPDALPDMRGLGAGSSSIQLRTTNEFVDLSSVTNRMHRYKEYERLRIMPEIEMAMTVFADEACVGGNTLISTPTYGFKSIQWLAENMANERFLVYCWDFNKEDFTLGWAFAPRITKEAETIRLVFNDGTEVVCTPDHRILNNKRQWVNAGQLRYGDTVLAFHHVDAKQSLTESRVNQFPRIYTHSKGWIHERQFVDEWRNGKTFENLDEVNQICRIIVGGLDIRQTKQRTGHDYKTVKGIINRAGWSIKELKWLSKKGETRRVVGVMPHKNIKVYDLSVEGHENFCTNWGVVHNCQRNENGRVFEINCDNQDIKEELEFLCFHRKMLNLDQKKIWNRTKNTFVTGDDFWEIVINPENPKEGIKGLVPLPAESMYRIETTKGRLVEFQQSKEGPDYESLAKVEVTTATEADLSQSKAIRFAPQQIVHVRIGDDRKTFYPYGVSLVEAARGPAHQLRMMEDAMVVYRLCRAPERRVFYVDIGPMAGPKAEALIERMKDQFKKKKTAPTNYHANGASAVEERWHAPAADEDYWIPIRTNSNTRVETLPGACLSLDTKIPLLDGTNDSLSKIIERWNNGETMWAYSCNPKNGNIVPGLITWAGLTRKNAQVVKVTFDNGESLICTPDHKFPVIGREGKIEAKDLNVGDSLIPFRERQKSIWGGNKTTYHQFYDAHLKKWVFDHRMVANYFKNDLVENFVFDSKNANQSNQTKIYGKSTINFPKKVFSYFMHRLADGVKNVDDILEEIKSNQNLMQEWRTENSHVCRKGMNIEEGLKRTHVSRMVKSYGYKNLEHAREESKLYNHTVVSVEYLDETQDVGTITIDGNEQYHNYHTFAVSPCGVMTYNSNLGEIDDTVYFRNKLFTALNFPRNYYNNEDPQSTRISLSAQDVKFARMIERLQSHIEDALWEVCDRHLKLRGYPEDAYEDLEIKLTPPSDWRELTRTEVVASRIQNAGSLKGAQMMSDYDILTLWMKYSEDEAKKMLARLKIQKLEELKLQIIAQNPALLGVGVPGPEEEQVSTEPGEDQPMLGGQPEGEEPPEPPAPSGNPAPLKPSGGGQGKGNVSPVPEPSDEDIQKYNLDINDYESEQDREEIDRSEL